MAVGISEGESFRAGNERWSDMNFLHWHIIACLGIVVLVGVIGVVVNVA